MSFYRDVYLKSEDWKNLRAAVLFRDDYCCQKCGFRSKSNDVHHIVYRHLWDVKTTDLITLCRKCHNRVHEKMALQPKARPTGHKWRVALEMIGGLLDPVKKQEKHARTQRRDNQKRLKKLKERLEVAKRKQLKTIGSPTLPHENLKVFHITLRKLVGLNLIIGCRMQVLEGCQHLPLTTNPVAYLEAYIQATGNDPRIVQGV